MAKLWQLTSRRELLKSMPVKFLPAIILKPVTQRLKSGLFVLVPAMCVDLVDAHREPYDRER